jgi:ankyrin repeat protein
LASEVGKNYLLVERRDSSELLSTFDMAAIKAIAAKNPSALQAAIAKGFPVNAVIRTGQIKEMTALHFAVDLAQDETVIATLLRGGANPNSKASFLQFADLTPMHLAAWHDSEKLIDLLHRSGATVDQPDRYGETPLAMAAHFGAPHAVAALLARGASVKASAAQPEAQSSGIQPLHSAAFMRFLDNVPNDQRLLALDSIVGLLLLAGADPNAIALLKGKQVTPLSQFAKTEGALGAIKLLVKAGANVNLVVNGATPLDLAVAASRNENAAYLRSVGGRPAKP